MPQLTLGDVITLAILGGGIYAFGRMAWVKVFGAPAEPVKSSPVSAGAVMSRAAEPAAATGASDLKTDGMPRQTDAPPVVTFPSATLDMCKDLRAHGYSREDARAFLKLAGFSLNNNTWAQAKPAESAPVSLTPIAGRPTAATFAEEEPELKYEPPPRCDTHTQAAARESIPAAGSWCVAG
jgi:hypothetical protein